MDTDTDVMIKRLFLQAMGKISLTCQSACAEAAEKTVWSLLHTFRVHQECN